MDKTKNAVKAFWEKDACGERLYLEGLNIESFNQHEAVRYGLEPYILQFADFRKYKDKKILEIGVGLGADHKMFAEAGAICTGIDLTDKAIEITRKRLEDNGLISELSVGDAENLHFSDNTFDLVWSWGVIHHSPDTRRAASEILRVLKPGGEFKIMIYNKYSIVGFMLWTRYALMTLKPMKSLADIYSTYMESPGTKAYTTPEAANLFSSAKQLVVQVELTHGDLLESGAGQRHRGILLSLARLVWPRFLIRKYLSSKGLFLLIQGIKQPE